MSSGELELVRELIELQAPSRAAPLAQRRRQYDQAEQTFGRDDEPGEIIDAGGCVAEWVLPQCDEMQPVVLYIHGGGYSLGSIRSHRHLAAAIGHETDAAVLSLNYRRAPEFPFPAAVNDAVAAACWLLERTEAPVILAGDSAGAGLVVATMIALRDASLPLPSAGVCLSPWADLTCTADAYTRLGDRDPLLCHAELKRMADVYLRDAGPHDPLASPVFAELTGLPPMLIQVGTDEILLDDARKLATAGRVEGVDVTLEEWPGMIHAWHWYFPVLSEGREAIAAIAAFIGRHVESTRASDEPIRSHATRRAPASLIQEAHLLIVPWTASRGYLNWVYQLNGPLDRQALAQAIDDVVRRHEILRVRFEPENGRMHQVVTSHTPGTLKLVDLGGHTKQEGLDLALEDVQGVYRSLSPSRDPRFRATLYSISPKTSVLAMFVAEALVDSDSGSLLSAEITRAYAKHTGSLVPAGLPEVNDASYLDYVASHHPDHTTVERSHEYWTRLACDTPPISSWPTNTDDGHATSSTFAFQFPPADWAAVASCAQSLRITPYILALTCLQLAIARVAGVLHFLAHAVVSQRSVAATGMIGNFHGLARIDMRLDPNASFAEAAAQTAATVADAIDHCALPAPLTKRRTLSPLPLGCPLPGIRFYLFANHDGPVFSGIRRRRFRLHGIAPAPLSVSCIYGPEGRQDFVFSSTVAPRAHVEYLATTVRDVLNAAVAAPEVPHRATIDSSASSGGLAAL